MEKITKITQYNNVTLYNKHHDKEYKSKEGIIVVEYENGKKSILDLQAQFDMTDSDFLVATIEKKSKEKVLFQDIDLENFENDN